MATSAAATLGVLLMLLALVGVWLFQGPGPAAHATDVVLPSGVRTPEIAAALEREGAISSSTVFLIAAQLTGAARHLKAGEYAFEPHTSMAAIMRMIRRGEIVHHLVTIPEGFTSQAVIDALDATSILTGSAPIPPEGAVLPETYEVQRGEDRAAVLQRMMDARDQLLAGLWAQRRQDLPLTSPEQAVILASIVEKETSLASERPRVAAVFLNRLQKGMKLESDPTVIYGLTRGVPLGRGIRESELTAPTPYNTYVIPGLPPTPICNPGRASLAAVLDAPRTDELYFVADGTGGHAFSSTLEQHQKNVAHWRAIEHAGAQPPPAPSAGAHG
ncbi:MAG TPA: endolytic transglycosylase MltG [Caulobacteraceae bacterium]|nr:endolytic transglycosylase MltG [Caulobacteraceae bacterium]